MAKFGFAEIARLFAVCTGIKDPVFVAFDTTHTRHPMDSARNYQAGSFYRNVFWQQQASYTLAGAQLRRCQKRPRSWAPRPAMAPRRRSEGATSSA